MKTVNLSLFREDPDNVSEASDEEIARLAEKLRRVPSGLAAMRIAYVTDCPPGYMVISGNKRLRCLKAAFGEDGEVPAEYFQDVTSMTAAERHEFRLNANISDGHWNLDRLLEQYGGDELSAAGLEDLLSELSTDKPAATEKTTPPPIARGSGETGAAFDFDNPKAESEKNNADNPEYQNFVDKFKPKKTTDDCYTPKIVYDTLADFVAFEYELDRDLFVRPFYPGGDYQAFDYSDGKIVVDNPPFSIMSEILSFYCERKIPFFLFAPALTLFSGAAQNHKLTYMVTSVNITYANGANVTTSFITNLDSLSGEDNIIQVRADLCELLKKANEENLKKSKKELPKYQFPHCVATSARLGYLAVHGENLSISRDAATFIAKGPMSTAERVRRHVASANDIPKIDPKPRHPRLKERCRNDLELFGWHYCRCVLKRRASKHTREGLIHDVQDTILHGGQSVKKYGRGVGKTTWTVYIATVWAIVYGHRRWPVLVSANTRLGKENLRSVKRILTSSEAIAQDFPEIVVPLLSVGDISQRAASVTYCGRPTDIEWSSDRIALPMLRGDDGKPLGPGCGARVTSVGIGGVMRGANKEGPRPDLLLIDDSQPTKIVHAPSIVKSVIRHIHNGATSLSGHDRPITAFVTMSCEYATKFIEDAIHHNSPFTRARQWYKDRREAFADYAIVDPQLYDHTNEVDDES